MSERINAIFEEPIHDFTNSISLDLTDAYSKSPYITSQEAQQRQQRVRQSNADFQELLEDRQINLSRKSIHLREFEKGNFNLGVIIDKSTLTLQKCITNIDCSSTLTIQARQFIRGSQFKVESRNLEGQTVEKYRYGLSRRLNSFLVRVYLPLNSKEFKLWKEMDLPITGDALRIEIKEISFRETILKVNDFSLRLLAQMPFIQESYFTLSNSLQFERIDLHIQNFPQEASPTANSCDSGCCII